MFKEFDPNALEQWNNLTEAERIKAIEKDEVQIAVDVEITIESHHKIVEEHKYYQVCSYGNVELINGIVVLKSTSQETTFKMNINNDNTNTFSIKIGEEKVIELGQTPYRTIYRIRVLNIRYGQALEL